MVQTERTRQLELFEIGRQPVTVSFDGKQAVSDVGLLPAAQLDRELGIRSEAVQLSPDPPWQLFVTRTAGDLLRQ